MLTDEYGKAENIKDRANRQSVQTAIVSAKELLRSYAGKNQFGVCVFTGNVKLANSNSIKKLKIIFEPYRKLTSKLYNCGPQFQTTPLEKLVESNDTFGFVIVDGNGLLLARLQGNTKTIVNKFTVDLPKKHGRGGQSQNRFANIRREKRLIYTKKVVEEITKAFITNDRPNVRNLVLGGYADFKTMVFENSTFDIRLKPIVAKIVDISYGMEQGLNQAIEMSKECFQNLRLVREQNMIQKFNDNINLDTGLVCYGVEETLQCLQAKAVDVLIVYENSDYQIVSLKPSN